MNQIFSEPSRKSIELANDEARRLNHDYIGTEHLLLGLIRGGPNKVTQIFEDASLEPQKLVLAIEDVIQPNTNAACAKKSLPVTARSKKCLELAKLEAQALQSKEIEPEHILLALLKDDEGVATQILSMYDFDYRAAYEGLTGVPSISAEWTSFPISTAVRDALQFAKTEASRLRHTKLGVSHIFLGLIQMETDPATQWLVNANLDLSKARAELEDLLLLEEYPNVYVSLRTLCLQVEQPKSTLCRVPTNSAYKLTLLLALKKAQEQGLREITTMCVLSAILRIPESLPAIVLARHNITYDMLKSGLQTA